MTQFFALSPTPNPKGTTGTRVHFDLTQELISPCERDPKACGECKNSVTPDGVLKTVCSVIGDGIKHGCDFLKVPGPLGPVVGDMFCNVNYMYRHFFAPERRGVFAWMILHNSDTVYDLEGTTLGGKTQGFSMISGDILRVSTSQGMDSIRHFLHEFGHNLGLGHAGNSGGHNKPNYVSVMNNAWREQGFWDEASNSCKAAKNATIADLVTNLSAYVKYSDGSRPSLDQNVMSEHHGVTPYQQTPYSNQYLQCYSPVGKDRDPFPGYPWLRRVRDPFNVTWVDPAPGFALPVPQAFQDCWISNVGFPPEGWEAYTDAVQHHGAVDWNGDCKIDNPPITQVCNASGCHYEGGAILNIYPPDDDFDPVKPNSTLWNSTSPNDVDPFTFGDQFVVRDYNDWATINLNLQHRLCPRQKFRFDICQAEQKGLCTTPAQETHRITGNSYLTRLATARGPGEVNIFNDSLSFLAKWQEVYLNLTSTGQYLECGQ